jgi:hypothetical protein
MTMRRVPGVLLLITVLAVTACREDREEAEAAEPQPHTLFPTLPPAPPATPRPPDAPQPPAAPAAPAPERPPEAVEPPEPPAAQDAPPPDAPELDLDAPWWMSFADVQGRGVLVERVEIRSFTLPLILPGDLVIGVDDRRVTTSDQLERYLRSIPPGSVVVFTIEREGTLHYVMLDVPEPPRE